MVGDGNKAKVAQIIGRENEIVKVKGAMPVIAKWDVFGLKRYECVFVCGPFKFLRAVKCCSTIHILRICECGWMPE